MNWVSRANQTSLMCSEVSLIFLQTNTHSRGTGDAILAGLLLMKGLVNVSAACFKWKDRLFVALSFYMNIEARGETEDVFCGPLNI